MELGLSGLASGFDWRSFIDQLMEVERAPQKALRNEQTRIQERNNAYRSLQTELQVLQNRLRDLLNPDLYAARRTAVGDANLLKAEAGTAAAPGLYTIEILQRATAARWVGVANVGAALSPSGDVSSLTLANAPFATAVTAGTFTVNGKQVSVETTDTLQDVFDKIAAATGGQVTAGYDAVSDRIILTSSSEIVLGSASDTSNFLQVARLYNNGTSTVASAGALGAVRLDATLAHANFATPVTDGGSGAGEFRINGVSITYNATTDTLATVLERINQSSAGVYATYDALSDRIVLTNKSTGDIGIALEDVTGNFLAAAGLTGGSLQRGQNLLFRVNGGDTLTSTSNTISAASSGIAGLTLTALGEGTTTVTVERDTDPVKQAIQRFLEAYNKVQALLDDYTSSTTDANGVVRAGVLAGESDANEIASRLRNLVYQQVSGFAPVADHLADLGITTSGEDNKLRLSDEAALDNLLRNDPGAVQRLLTDESRGVAVRLQAYLERLVGDDGTLIRKQTTLARQSSDIDAQIREMERLVQANRQRMIEAFTAMEQAQARINQQLQYLLRTFGQGS
ncbi:flagellar filament capping protein FliD [Limisphaera ngatamarikiensis]|uniref:Flagellar hook-associated protein 2 n=1 Tax=Limisphaera ngatamarikiensis TaxID=1324935 RepID=A0A6M1RQZ4_9BACT|nr:flagellar filament capping protein FliD [Limisphaera ngatamarikiensis]NGO40093.1 flagellar filament capping protein FliD [Limisphaera ngatamarikiensis]